MKPRTLTCLVALLLACALPAKTFSLEWAGETLYVFSPQGWQAVQADAPGLLLMIEDRANHRTAQVFAYPRPEPRGQIDPLGFLKSWLNDLSARLPSWQPSGVPAKGELRSRPAAFAYGDLTLDDPTGQPIEMVAYITALASEQSYFIFWASARTPVPQSEVLDLQRMAQFLTIESPETTSDAFPAPPAP